MDREDIVRMFEEDPGSIALREAIIRDPEGVAEALSLPVTVLRGLRGGLLLGGNEKGS